LAEEGGIDPVDNIPLNGGLNANTTEANSGAVESGGFELSQNYPNPFNEGGSFFFA
jgi:hypothetical protein